jgi:hypothetical protein
MTTLRLPMWPQEPTGRWRLSSSSSKAALAVVDGLGRFDGMGPHYSRRNPGSRTFTGVGKEIVLISDCGRAVWAVVLQKTPAKRGTGSSRGRSGQADSGSRWVWRNMLFRNLGAGLSSNLIKSATVATYIEWRNRYGELPDVARLVDGGLRTEIGIGKIQSSNPGYCYQCAGWDVIGTRRGIRFLRAPPPPPALTVHKGRGGRG